MTTNPPKQPPSKTHDNPAKSDAKPKSIHSLSLLTNGVSRRFCWLAHRVSVAQCVVSLKISPRNLALSRREGAGRDDALREWHVQCTPSPLASGRSQGCSVPALAPPEDVLTPAATAPAASRQTPAPASTAAGHSRVPGGGERHAPSHARDTASCPYIAGIPRSRDAPSPDRGKSSRRMPIPDLPAPASRSTSRARVPQNVVP